MNEKALLGIILFPLLGAVANGLFGRHADRRVVHAIAVTSIAFSFGLAVMAFAHLLKLRLDDQEHASISYYAYDWFSLSLAKRPLVVQVRFVMDALSGVMTLIVTGIGLLIHIYSTGYMSEEPSYARFFSYMNLFMASMLILILGSSLPVMFVGWEGVGLCSYLLIGFWFENATFAAAGRKAFVANRIGDFGVIIGMLLLACVTHSFEFSDINRIALTHPGALVGDLALGPIGAPYFSIAGISLATVATLFLLLGCTGKSAQIPLFVWLPDAMAGPTPVSALIHAATMVTSGVYLVCRLSPLFALAPVTMAVMAVIGTLTALMAASIGVVQNDIKKVLAYSTVSQLGFMFAAVGCGAFAAGIMHVYTHAFFKACLFLCAGSVMHAVGAHGDADIRRLGGLRKYMPFTRWTFLLSCLAISGVPFFSGFFSKDEILVGALSVNGYFAFAPWLGKAVYAGLVVAAAMTAFYMFRLYFLTFSGEYRGGPVHEESAHAPPAADDDHAHGHGDVDTHAHDDRHGHAHEPHESPAAMTFPLVVLAFGAVFAGYVWVGIAHFEPWVTWLEPVLGTIGAEHAASASFAAMGGGLFAAGFGIFLAYLFYFRGSDVPARMAASLPGLHRLLMDKWRIDELYDATILGASRMLAVFCAAFDKYIIDGIFTEVTSQTINAASFLFTRIQNGLVHAYGAVMAVGLLAIAFHAVVPHPKVRVIGEQTGRKVQLEASNGLSYEFRWDYDGDGTFDTDWSTEPKVEHEYADADFTRFAVVFESASFGARPETIQVTPGKRIAFSKGDLGASWQLDTGGDTPVVVADEHGVTVHPKGARVRKDGSLQAADSDVHVGIGEHVSIGEARLSVTGFVRPRMQVRNAFGMLRVGRVNVVVPPVTPRMTAEVAALGGGAP